MLFKLPAIYCIVQYNAFAPSASHVRSCKFWTLISLSGHAMAHRLAKQAFTIGNVKRIVNRSKYCSAGNTRQLLPDGARVCISPGQSSVSCAICDAFWKDIAQPIGRRYK